MTTRRRFLIALGAGVLAVPRGSLAQPQSKVARIGFLYFGSRQPSLDTGRYNAFVQGMRELGYVEGTNFLIEARFADGKPERLPAHAAELVRLKVDVIVATGTPVYRALQHATTTIPVVITVTFDPVGDGFAASMARPGGNMTGLSLGAADLGPKLLELLKVAVPKLPHHMSKKVDKGDRVKVTIKLPRTLVHAAKVHALMRHQDLQDLVAGVLANYLKDQAAAKSPSRSALQQMAMGYGVDQRLAALKKIRNES